MKCGGASAEDVARSPSPSPAESNIVSHSERLAAALFAILLLDRAARSRGNLRYAFFEKVRAPRELSSRAQRGNPIPDANLQGITLPPCSNDNSLDTSYQLPGTQSLFAIVQGGMYPDLRRECAERLVGMNFPGYAIGGLSVGEPRALTYETVQAVEPHLPQEKPRYLMGVGTPEEIVEYAGMGIDMMDCVLPTRAARHGLLFTSEGKVNIKNSRYALDESPLDPNCRCRVCTRYSRAYLRHLYSSGELLAQVLNTIHNVAFYLDTMKAVRHAIQLGEFSRFLSGVRARGLNSPAHT